MQQPNTLPSKSSTSNTPTGMETCAPEQGDLAKLVEQMQNKLVELENRLLQLTGSYHLLLMAYRNQNDPVTFTTLDRIENLEARLDSIKTLPSQ